MWLTVTDSSGAGASPVLCQVPSGCCRPGWHSAGQPGGFHRQRAEGREEGAWHRAARGAPGLTPALCTCSDPAVFGVWSASKEMQVKKGLVTRPGTYVHSTKGCGQQPPSRPRPPHPSLQVKLSQLALALERTQSRSEMLGARTQRMNLGGHTGQPLTVTHVKAPAHSKTSINVTPALPKFQKNNNQH